MASLQECCCCRASHPPAASQSSTEVTVNGVKVPDRTAPVHGVMESGQEAVKSPRKSSSRGVSRKLSVFESVDCDDSVFITEQTSTILVLYCGGTIGMRSHHGGTSNHRMDPD